MTNPMRYEIIGFSLDKSGNELVHWQGEGRSGIFRLEDIYLKTPPWKPIFRKRFWWKGKPWQIDGNSFSEVRRVLKDEIIKVMNDEVQRDD